MIYLSLDERQPFDLLISPSPCEKIRWVSIACRYVIGIAASLDPTRELGQERGEQVQIARIHRVHEQQSIAER